MVKGSERCRLGNRLGEPGWKFCLGVRLVQSREDDGESDLIVIDKEPG